ncbi:VanZ family protein [Indiicoccus explosivorum]|uniref:VanZ family protein n=1 Tax=Indiicoccus explosivorum TaxID=1917864 RepID=UPI000B43DA36|nr:VanZ family protein [Indiicoccus explosivorum]
MRILLCLWIVFMLVGMCTSDVFAFLLEGKVNFRFTSEVHFAELFHVKPLQAVSKLELIGHFGMFFILAGLLSAVLKNTISVVLFTLFFGAGTEILQLFFNRGTSPYDFLANTAGVLLFLLCRKIWKEEMGRIRKERKVWEI